MTVAHAAAVRYHQPASPTSLDPVLTRRRRPIGHGVVLRLLRRLPAPAGARRARLGGLGPLQLTVGLREMEVKTFGGRFVEKRVPLPERRLRGLAEVQVLAASIPPA